MYICHLNMYFLCKTIFTIRLGDQYLCVCVCLFVSVYVRECVTNCFRILKT